MKRNIGYWKFCARQALAGNYLLPVVGTIMVMGASFIGTSLTGSLFQGMSVPTRILSEAFAFILTLILNVFSAGLACMFLNIARKREYSLGNLLFFFKNNPDRVIAAAFVLTLIGRVTSLPCDYYMYASAPGMNASLEETVAWTSNYLMIYSLCLVLNILLTIPFIMTYYLLADHPEMNGVQALKESVRLTRGYRLKYLLLQISFIPWVFAAMFTLGIALLWLEPYMEMSRVMLYRDLSGEFDVPLVTGEQNAQ